MKSAGKIVLFIGGVWFVALICVSVLDRIAIGMSEECEYREINHWTYKVCTEEPMAPLMNLAIVAAVITAFVMWRMMRKEPPYRV